MGIVQSQVLRNNALSILGVAIGAFAQLYVYTLNLEVKGLADALLKWAQLLAPFFMLGTTSVMVRMLPYVSGEREAGAGRLYGRALTVLVATCITAGLLLWAGGADYLARQLSEGAEIGYLGSRPYLILCLILMTGLIAVQTTHLMNALRIDVPVVASSIIPKLGLIALVLLTVYGSLQREGFAYGLIALYGLSSLFLFWYSRRRGAARPSLGTLGLSAAARRQMYALGGYSILGSLGSVLATHIDTVFVSTYLGDVDTAIYSFAIFATTVIQLPNKAVQSITSPIVAQEWKNGNLAHLGMLYRDSAAVLLAAGGMIYAGGVVCLPHVYALAERTENLSLSYWVFIYLGAGALFDLMTSINSTLIGNTDYFRWNVLFVVLLGTVNIVLNYVFIAQLEQGLQGAAIATALSLLLYNVVKTAFVYFRMGLHPLSLGIFYTGAVILGSVGLALALPESDIPLVNILLRGSVVVISFFLYLRFTNGVPALRKFLTELKMPFGG
ncbi:MAG: polysaccharide biosynthesis C-terminal domain-containing protein [Lewinella sp.]